MLSDQPIMIVEDEALVAMDLADAVVELKGRVVGPLATVAEALQVLEDVAIAGAILDGKLADRDITPVALRLARMRVPLVIFTGTGLPPEVAAQWPDLPVLMKPASSQIVVQRLLYEIQNLASSNIGSV